MANKTYEERKRQKEEKKESQRVAAKKEGGSKRWIMAGGFVLLVGGVVLFFSFNLPGDRPGEFHPEQGREHVSDWNEAPYEWSTNPPTSGWHDPSTLPAGFYEVEQDFPPIIHSLEHGAIAIYYHPEVPEEEKESLQRFYEDNSDKKLIIAPYSEMDSNYALTAWQYKDKFDEYDELRMSEFLRSHHDRGPEPGASI